MTCGQKLVELLDPPLCSTIECICVAQNKPAHVDCLKKQCPDNWEQIHTGEMKPCTGVDISGNTTYTDIGIPTPTWLSGSFAYNPSSKSGKLSQSDKIAIGLGVGFGVPTILVGLGAWLFARRREVLIKRASISQILGSQKRERK
ncbi:hypothetical protein FGG08_000033 [Glutinoglossum americanum]|uniref:Uncharacterized protein n=1 Tax=Glutinoglossum americanum TaxID=1670608 RepID=A0A9P8IAY6_9PEZI|nr:hypothetical protein FGG08_000033 [Glutinoglossum americanum]